MKYTAACTNCFGSLATFSRLRIVGLLQQQPQLSVLEIARHFRLSQPTITHHLQNLKESGILNSKKEGRKVYYFLDPKCQRKECHVFKR